ncbi:MAG: hypothetical protein JO100_11190 [Pseudonocardia sp.]|nr:hypothetical protein [Pseudonocardia sp.]
MNSDATTATASSDPVDLNWRVLVPAAELDEWAWLITRLAGWLDQSSQTTAAEFTEYFQARPTVEAAIWHLDQITERITTLIYQWARQ